MIDPQTRAKYTATIGIECHVQFKTQTKLFTGIGNDAREAAPNTLAGPLCFGLPGSLPVLNKEAVHLGIRAAFALGTPPQKFSAFDRKHYFYPDLPLGYQITQFNNPIVRDGKVIVDVDGEAKTVRIHEAHLEADAGKSTHPAGTDYSLVDLNRAGTPLIEIVSEPDMHTPAEARAYAHELYLLMRYADVSDCNLFYGNMRFDVNVSVSKTSELGTRTETKNLNSFRAVEKAAEYEIQRQIELLEKGEAIVQETRGWNDAKQKTFTQRTKEDAHDYRYFPEPDIPPIVLDDEQIQTVEAEMPAMPNDWRARLKALGLDKPSMELLLEAELDDAEVHYLPLIEETIADKDFAKAMANWFVNLEIPLRADESQNLAKQTNQARLNFYKQTYELVKAGKLSSTNAKELLAKLLSTAEEVLSVEDFAKQHNLIQESNEGEISKIVAKVLEENPKAAEDVKNGELKAIGFLVGQVMKASQGKANPGLAQTLIKKQLGI
ncbi:MAG TPA: Asp-tRNA(Asn)/Glu-tRNA(Gln) amidotransferase subunit GatB [Candidatus Saccharimonadales bacterium]